ncbi:hypothetical protein SLS53_001108 [Cytospora paraplurivora]|uniref:Uncharacterized protein n=1 Tax=Cytospora paraplurivora TaxID=2898453 RepID=A0AAN9YM87_9PEZI
MISLAGKTALITGGSRGIGNAIAQRFAQEGARCLLVGRNESSLQAACSDLPQGTSSPLGHTFFQGEVGYAKTWDGIVDRLSEESISVDVLVNAAGVSQASLLVKTSPSEIEAILDTNLRSTVLGCRVIGKQMMKRARTERPSCSIINVSSVMATRGGTGASVYAASKAGILGLTSALSQEMGQFQVRVNALAPGYIETSMIESEY